MLFSVVTESGGTELFDQRFDAFVSGVPCVGIFRRERFDLDGFADHVAHLLQRIDATCGARLQHDVADGRAFRRAGDDGYAGCVGRELV